VEEIQGSFADIQGSFAGILGSFEREETPRLMRELYTCTPNLPSPSFADIQGSFAGILGSFERNTMGRCEDYTLAYSSFGKKVGLFWKEIQGSFADMQGLRLMETRIV